MFTVIVAVPALPPPATDTGLDSGCVVGETSGLISGVGVAYMHDSSSTVAASLKLVAVGSVQPEIGVGVGDEDTSGLGVTVGVGVGVAYVQEPSSTVAEAL